jgi:hypothetical protein
MNRRSPLAPGNTRLILLAVIAAIAPGGAVDAQAVEPRVPVQRTELGGRVHLQLNSTSVDGEVTSEFLVRRARLWVAGRVNDWIDGAVQIDASLGKVAARYAFVRLTPSPGMSVSLGQFKRAFDNFELTSSSQILVVERDGDIRGAGDCAGVGGVCSYSRFSERLLLSSLDVGVLIQGDLAGGRLGYLLSATNGPGPNVREENDTKSFSGRLEWNAGDGVRVGVNTAVHDYPNPVTGTDAFAPALALDLELGDFDEGFHLQAGVMAGQNWLNLDDRGVESDFLTWQGIATYLVPLGEEGRIRGIEPVGRVSWGDPNRDATSDGGLLLTPGLVLHFEGRNKIGANLDVWRPQEGAVAWGLKAQTYLYF